MATLGYARVSTSDQTADPQRRQLEALGCDRIFTDYASGATRQRPQLQQLLDYARSGDVIAVAATDRLTRSMTDLVMMLDEFNKRGLQFLSLREGWDTTKPADRLMLHMAGALAEWERAMIAERTRLGLAAARERGAAIGRPTVLTEDVLKRIEELTRQQIPAPVIAQELKISRASVDRGRQMLAKVPE